MWAALFRQFIAVGMRTARGRRTLGLVGALLLCFVTVLLIDLRLYLTAGFTGLLALALFVRWLVQYSRQTKKDRVREQREVEESLRSAEAARTRGGMVGNAKSAVVGAAEAVSSGAVGVVAATKTGVAGAIDSLSFWRSKRSQ